MADRLPPIDPPVRYPRYNAPEPAEKEFSRERERKRGGEKVVKRSKLFPKSFISQYLITGEFDIVFFTLTMLLMAIGLVMLLSASYPTAYYHTDNSYSYFNKQLIFAVGGVVAMLVASKIDYKIYKDFLKIILPVSLALLVIVLFYNTGRTSANGEEFRRYIPILGITFQPSEVAKFSLIVTLAMYFSKFASKIKSFKYGIFFPLVIIAVFCGLIVLENHVSCTILMFLIGASIMFSGGSNKWIFWLGVIAVVAAVIVVFMFPQMLPIYVQDKLAAFTDKNFEPLGGRWQINNSLYAIGSGGFFGVGLGNSKQKYMYVSEPQNDFIFSIVCEELGFVGAMVIIILFVLLVLRGIQISMKARDKFGSYIALGITAQIGIQTVFNILVVTDAIPNTGIALPFFSYGGTALLMLLFEAGVMLSISRKANQRKI